MRAGSADRRAPGARSISRSSARRVAALGAIGLLAILGTPAGAAPSAGPGQEPESLFEPVAIRSAESDDGASVERLDDGSVLLTGPQGARTHLTLDLDLELDGIRGLRLEALPDPRLPGGGPGRADDGGFKLSDLRVTWASGSGSRRRTEAVLVGAEPLGAPADGPPHHAIDGSPATAWGPEAGGAACAALFLFDAPLPADAGSSLRLVLGHEHRDRHAVGRVRVSVTRHPDPRAALGLDADADRAALTARVREAIGRGSEYLLSQQHLDGSWRFEHGAYPTGSTALAAYTLMRCGLSRDHPSVERAIAFLLPRPPRKTYSTALQLMALELHGGERHLDAIEPRAEALLDWQTRGGWNYPGHWADPGNKSYPPDLSITQYALLGLRAAEEAGFEVPAKVWRDARDWTLDHQEDVRSNEPAGFFYAPGRDVTGSMTAAGLTALGVIAERTGEEPRDAREAAERALAWLAREFTVGRNPRPARGTALHDEDRWTLYYLYGIERVAGLYDLDAIGPHRWFEQGATRLIETQRDDGSWFAPHYGQPAQEVADTCFALLFLARATSSGVTGDLAAGRRLREAAAPDGGETVRAVERVPFRIWIDDLDPALRAAHALGPDAEPEVRAVRWEELGPDGGVRALLAEAEVGPRADRRFPARFTFTTPGRHRVRPTVVLVDGAGREVEHAGPVLELDQPFADHADLRRYARDGVDNLLRGAEVEELAVSSQLSGDWAAAELVDGGQVHGWCSADDDVEPWLRLDLGRGVRADTLLLSPLQEPWAKDPWRTGLPLRCALSVNGARAIEFEVAPDRWTKTEVDLGRPIRVRELELRILTRQGVHPAHPAQAGVGFAELELLLRD